MQLAFTQGGRRLVTPRTRQVASAKPGARPVQPQRRRRAAAQRGWQPLRVVAHLDYVASPSDSGILKLPSRTELDTEEIKDVFGYPRCVGRGWAGLCKGLGRLARVRWRRPPYHVHEQHAHSPPKHRRNPEYALLLGAL